MAIIAYPFEAQDITEAEYGALIGSGLSSGVVGYPATNHFKVVATTGMVLSATSVGGASLALIRGHACVMTTNTNVTVAAASAGARVDLIVLRMDYTTNSIVVAAKSGTSGSSTPPTVTWGTSGVYEIPLALVAVGAGVVTLSNGNITDIRTFAGATVGAWPEAQRPTGKPALGYNLTAAKWEATLDGTTWVNLSLTDHTLDSHMGVLAVSKGGTGSTTKATAQNALNIFPQSSAPAHEAGRIWIKLP